jgi:hypothetical protein
VRSGVRVGVKWERSGGRREVEVGVKMGSRLKWDEMEVEGLNSTQLKSTQPK